MALRCKLSSHKKTNHSARKTVITTLLHNNVAPTSVIQLTGHKNVQSLNSYSALSVDQQEEISRTISRHVAATTEESTVQPLPAEHENSAMIVPLSPGLQAQLMCDFDDLDTTVGSSHLQACPDPLQFAAPSSSNPLHFAAPPSSASLAPVYNIYMQGANITGGNITFNLGRA